MGICIRDNMVAPPVGTLWRLIIVLGLIALPAFLCRDPAWCEDRAAVLRLDCREGAGLIPTLWQGLSGVRDGIPEGLELRAVRLDPAMVLSAWRPGPEAEADPWWALEAAVDSAYVRGVDVILPIPLPPEGETGDDGSRLVFETVRRLASRVAYFEVTPGPVHTAEDTGRYLRFYESAVWAAYRAEPDAVVGGPGADWRSGTVEALAEWCRERSLPLRFVSWHAEVKVPADLAGSAAAAQAVLDRHPLSPRPALLITRWRAAPDSGVDATALSLSSLLPLLGMDVEVACFEPRGDLSPLLALSELGRVRLAIGMDPGPVRTGPVVTGPVGIAAMASLGSEEVVALLWSPRGAEGEPARLSLTGLPWGRRVRVRRIEFQDRARTGSVVREEVLPMEEPLDVDVPAGGRNVRVVRIRVMD